MLRKLTLIILIFSYSISLLQAQEKTKRNFTVNTEQMQPVEKMKIEVWSDVMCPFCYIGKKKFEAALSEFANKNNTELTWKSFQLDPSIQSNTGLSSAEYLAQRKGMQLLQVKEMQANVAHMAEKAGLKFDFGKSVVANSFDAHRISHLALKHGVQDKVEELLFAAHFTNGKDIADKNTLVEIAKEAGIPEEETRKVLENKDFAKEVLSDIDEAQQLGISGVPFFVFNRKYAVSGAQDSKVFLQTLNTAFSEWEKQKAASGLQVTKGESCDVNGDCK